MKHRDVSHLLEIIHSYSFSHVPTPALSTHDTYIGNPAIASTITGVVFDVYGTLLHSSAGEISITETTQDAQLIVPEIGLRVKVSAIQAQLHEVIASIHRTKKDSGIDYPEVDIIEVWKQLSHQSALFSSPLSTEEAMLASLYYELTVNSAWPMPHALDTLNYLYQHGYQLGIISNAQFYTPLILQVLFGKAWNDIIFTQQTWSYQLGIAKPSHAIYEHFIAQSGIPAEQILYIGNDTAKDIAPAQALGMHTVLYAGDTSSYRPHHNHPVLSAITPNSVVIDFYTILDYLNVPYICYNN